MIDTQYPYTYIVRLYRLISTFFEYRGSICAMQCCWRPWRRCQEWWEECFCTWNLYGGSNIVADGSKPCSKRLRTSVCISWPSSNSHNPNGKFPIWYNVYTTETVKSNIEFSTFSFEFLNQLWFDLEQLSSWQIYIHKFLKMYLIYPFEFVF